MKINKLRIKNMYGVKGDVEYDLSPRIVGLFGKNGAGKSSVINSLKLAIGGEKTSSAMLRGVDNSAVRIQTDTVTIDRQLKKTETGSVMTGWIDGKKTPGNRIQIDLASRLETTKDNLKTLSSKDIEKSLAENAGKILLSFADDELTSSEVKELLTKEAGETTDFNKEDINKVRFPDHIMWQDAESIASEYKKKTSGLRAEIKGMEAKNNELKVQQMQIVKKIKERKKLFYLADFIAKQFSQKGIVSQNLLGKYIKTLTDAASKAEAETGIRVIFKNDNGISISYCINGDVDTENGRDYETLSEGEKMLAFLTVTDLLHRIANIPVLLLDNVDKLDAENFDHLLTLLDRVADSYENIIIAGVDHEEFTSILEKHNIPNILQ